MTGGIEQAARGMIEIAERRLLREHVFHARFLATWHKHPTPAVPTVGVTVRNGRILLLYNVDFVLTCSLAELGGVLLHECNHVLFRHLLADPRRFPDAEALLIAQETTANEWIREPLPGRPILLSQYPQLPAGEDTETRYGRLAEHRRRNRRRRYRKSPLTGRNSRHSGPKTRRQRSNPGTLCPLDDHDIWDGVRAAGALGGLTVRVSLRKAAETLSPREREAVSKAPWLQALKKSRTDVANPVLEFLSPSDGCCVRWQRVLRRYVCEAADQRPVFNRPPRRFPELVGVLPSLRRTSDRAHLMAVLDTSGSMSASSLAMIGAELKEMSRAHRITVVECDQTVRAVGAFRGVLEAVRGRRGTDLRPPFEQSLLAEVRPDVIVYFTDGCGPAPDRPPPVPVIWCLSSGGHKPAGWGREISLSVVDEDEDRGEP